MFTFAQLLENIVYVTWSLHSDQWASGTILSVFNLYFYTRFISLIT